MSGALLVWLAGAAVAGEFNGTLKELGLEGAGGLGGAPEGMAFILPPGASAAATFGPLGEGVDGIRLEVKQPGDALVCTQPMPLGPQAFFRARVRVPEITAGNASWMGMNVELRARDGMGGLVGQYVMIRNVREPMGWQDVDQRLTVPTGATQGEFCFRFVLSTGSVEIDKIHVVSKLDGGAPVVPVAAVAAVAAAQEAAVAPPPPVLARPVAAPPPPVVAPAPPPRAALPAAPVYAAAPAAVSALGGAESSGFSLRLDIRGSSVGCSRWVAPAAMVRVSGRAALSVVNPDAAGWSGLGVEAYARDAQGRALLSNGSPWASLFVTTTAGPEQSFSVDWTPPAGAARVRVCARFADAAGSVDFDL